MTDRAPIVFIVDDDQDSRDSLAFVIKSAGLATEIYSTAKDFLKNYQIEQPGCLVLDQNMPDMTGTELQAELVKRHILMPVIFLTGHGDIPMTVRAIQGGAIDFLMKPPKLNILLERIHDGIVQDVRRVAQGSTQERLASLTKREHEVAALVVNGCSNKEIAHQLRISVRTVENHRANLMSKTNVSNLAELIRLFDN